MKTIDFSYFIERYIAGEMDQTEKRWFEKELNGNEALRKEVVLRRKVDNIMVNHDILALRSKLADLERNRKEKAVSDSASRRTMPVRYAAMFAGLLMIGTLLTITMKQKSPDELFNGFYKQYQIEPAVRSASQNNGENLLIKAAEFYNNSDFNSAAEYFSQFLATNPDRVDGHLYKGLSEMGRENYPVANIEFRSVLNGKANLHQDKARWYLALSLLKTGNKEEAIKELEAIIASEENIYRKDARKILRNL